MDFPDQGQEARGQSERQVVDKFERLQYAAVKRRLCADVPVASYLSGGVELSTVVAIARDVLGRAPATFTSKICDPKSTETARPPHLKYFVTAVPVRGRSCGLDQSSGNYQRLISLTMERAMECLVVNRCSGCSPEKLMTKVSQVGAATVVKGAEECAGRNLGSEWSGRLGDGRIRAAGSTPPSKKMILNWLGM